MIDTERLFLREMTDCDFDSLYRVLADSENMKYYPYTFDEKRVRNWIFRNQERYRIFGFGLWAVCLKDTGEMIGDCGLSMQTIDGVIRPEIGYHIRADKQGQGYAKEAAIAVRDWVFDNTPFQEIYSYMFADNEASARTAMAYGCRFFCEYTNESGEHLKVYMVSKDKPKSRFAPQRYPKQFYNNPTKIHNQTEKEK